MNPSVIFHHEVMRAVASSLRVPHEDWMQDWPIEVADKSRLAEFVGRCGKSEKSEHRLLTMELILASLDRAFAEGSTSDQILASVESLIREDFSFFEPVTRYWKCEESESDIFSITPWLRSVLK